MAAALLIIGVEGGDVALLPVRDAVLVPVIVGVVPVRTLFLRVGYAVAVGLLIAAALNGKVIGVLVRIVVDDGEVAVRSPVADGLKVTWKVVFPPAATGETGWTVTVKSAALVPPITTFGVPVRVRSMVPVLRIVKVCTTVPEVVSVLPKSVQIGRAGRGIAVRDGDAVPLDVDPRV